LAVHPVIMPKLGAYTEDVLLAGWLVAEGQRVDAGGSVLELETEKTTAEVEADVGGFVHQVVPAGDSVPIGATVGMIAETIEEYHALAGAANGAAPDMQHRRSAPLVSPRARALLRELGYTLDDAREIAGSGPGGRIVDSDVATWAEARHTPAEPADSGGLTVVREIPLRGRRKTIATRMLASLHESAQLTSVLELDVQPLVRLRTALNDRGAEPRIGVTTIVVKLAAHALRTHPILNARVTDVSIELLEEINIAVAVDTDAGLVAPVVRGADRLSLEEINRRMADLVERARRSALTPEDLADGTFTVSNGGTHPVDITTAILNPPQCGILWVGRIKDRPVAVGDGAIAVRPTMQACLTFDHRAVDGAPAAAFLGTFEQLVNALQELPS
jgi:pyruvate/2-oxoglutarate dehydrogenase complex dihydrolipoamide acyltransferase (E2) component